MEVQFPEDQPLGLFPVVNGDWEEFLHLGAEDICQVDEPREAAVDAMHAAAESGANTPPPVAASGSCSISLDTLMLSEKGQDEPKLQQQIFRLHCAYLEFQQQFDATPVSDIPPFSHCPVLKRPPCFTSQFMTDLQAEPSRWDPRTFRLSVAVCIIDPERGVAEGVSVCFRCTCLHQLCAVIRLGHALFLCVACLF